MAGRDEHWCHDCAGLCAVAGFPDADAGLLCAACGGCFVEVVDGPSHLQELAGIVSSSSSPPPPSDAAAAAAASHPPSPAAPLQEPAQQLAPQPAPQPLPPGFRFTPAAPAMATAAPPANANPNAALGHQAVNTMAAMYVPAIAQQFGQQFGQFSQVVSATLGAVGIPQPPQPQVHQHRHAHSHGHAHAHTHTHGGAPRFVGNPVQFSFAHSHAPQGGPAPAGDLFNDMLHRMFQEHQHEAPSNPPASTAAVASLPSFRADEAFCAESTEACSVCQDSWAVEDECTRMPCEHTFHSECLAPWLRQHNTCPTCRYTQSNSLYAPPLSSHPFNTTPFHTPPPHTDTNCQPRKQNTTKPEERAAEAELALHRHSHTHHP